MTTVINGIPCTASQVNFLVSELGRVRSGAAGHVKYAADGTVFALSAFQLQVIFPKNYTTARDAFFLCVSNDYWYPGDEAAEGARGYTKAWKFRPSTVAALAECKITPQAEEPGTLKEKFLYDILASLLNTTSNNFWHNSEDAVISKLFLAGSTREEDGTGVCFVKYRRTYQGGREFAAGPSLQTIPKYVRELIMDNSTDVDMCNAHPTIIIADHKHRTGATLPTLEDYIVNREVRLTELGEFYKVTRKAAKQLMLMTTYGCSFGKYSPAYTDWLAKNCGGLPASQIYDARGAYRIPAFLKNYSSELKLYADTLKAEHPWAAGMKGSTASVSSKVVQMYEADMLSVMEAFCKVKEIEVQCKMFDGFLVEGFMSDELLRELEGHLSTYSLGTYGFSIDIKLVKKFYKKPVEEVESIDYDHEFEIIKFMEMSE